MKLNFYSITVVLFITVITPDFSFGSSDYLNDLKYVEKIALEKSPELKKILSQKSAFEEASVADNQLKDPEIQVGIINIPTDTFSLDQDNMTQLKFALVQKFPKGKSLKFISQAKKFMAISELHKLQNKKAEIIKDVRLNWIELYYLLESKKHLEKTKKIFKELVEIVTLKLSSGTGYQHDVLEAQIKSTEIENKLIKNQENIENIRVNFVRLAGEVTAKKILPEIIPDLPNLLQEEDFKKKIKNHPLIQQANSLLKAAKKKLEATKESYKPAWSVGLQYSIRQGDFPATGEERSDFLGLQFSTELPFFTGNRQDKRVAESLKNYQSVQNQYLITLLDFVKEISQNYIVYRKLEKQEKLYRDNFLKEVKQYAEATLNSYKNSQAEFDTVSRAHNKVLNVSLEYLRIITKKMQAHAQILYLQANI